MKQTIAAFVGGVLITLIVWGVFQEKNMASQPKVIATLDGSKLTYEKLRELASNDLIPVENDEFLVLQYHTEDWINKQLIAKEAKSKNADRDKFFEKEVWGRVNVSYEEMIRYYNDNRELFNKSFEKESSKIAYELRRAAYIKEKDKFLEDLRAKYNLKVFLKAPDSHIDGLAVSGRKPGEAKGGKAPVKKKVQPKKQAPAKAAPKPTAKPTAAKKLPIDPSAIAFNDLDGRPSKGPKDAIITMVEYSDFHCPFCKRLTPTLDKIVEDYKGKVRLVWRHYPLAFHKGADRTHEASECAHEQGKFWEYHDEVFATMGGDRSDVGLKAMAAKIGLDEKRFAQCLESGKYKDLIRQELRSANNTGMRGTPATFVNGRLVSGARPYNEFKRIVDSYLTTGKFPEARAAQPAAAPAAGGGNEGASFDDLDGRPFKGAKDAKITMVEFSDFHCPFCGRLPATLNKIIEKYPNDVKLVFRHNPLSFHKGADRTHAASECAHEQGKFWEYHDELFANMKGDKSDAGLVAVAKKVGVKDIKVFETCLKSNKNKSVVDSDLAAGRKAGVRGTPATFVNGHLVSGARPFDDFDKVVDTIMKTGKPPAPAPARRAAPAAKIAEFNDLDGRPFKGAKDAKITMVEFSDFHCPFCGRLPATLNKVIEKYPDQVKLVFRHNPLSFHKGAERTHAASECAHEQGKFWEYHDAVFANMKGDKSDAGLVAIAKQVGVKDTKQFEQCLKSDKYKKVVDSDLAAGRKAGVRGTPATFVNGYLVSGARPFSAFEEVVQTIIKTGKPPKPTAAPSRPAAPKNVKFDDLKGRPFKGPENAPVTIVEFSDFHCPFCSRVEPTIDKIRENYPDKVKVVWRHYPLPFHKGAEKTHEASECAHDQGKFWEYHKELFANMKGDKSTDGLVAIAKKLGLNTKTFRQCLTSGKHKGVVDSDLAAGKKAGVRGTPASFVGGDLVSGAQPYEKFEEVVLAKLKKS